MKIKVRSLIKAGLRLNPTNYTKSGEEVKFISKHGDVLDFILPHSDKALILDLDDEVDKHNYDVFVKLQDSSYKYDFEFVDYEQEVRQSVGLEEKRASAIMAVAKLEPNKLRAVAAMLNVSTIEHDTAKEKDAAEIKTSIYVICNANPDKVLEAIASKPLAKAEAVFNKCLELGIIVSVENGAYRISGHSTNAQVRSLPAMMESAPRAVQIVSEWLTDCEDEVATLTAAAQAAKRSVGEVEDEEVKATDLTTEELITHAKSIGILTKSAPNANYFLGNVDTGVKSKVDFTAFILKPENAYLHKEMTDAVKQQLVSQ